LARLDDQRLELLAKIPVQNGWVILDSLGNGTIAWIDDQFSKLARPTVLDSRAGYGRVRVGKEKGELVCDRGDKLFGISTGLVSTFEKETAPQATSCR
jgi:hypothetical protein